MSATAQSIDQAKLDEFMGRFVGDLGAAISAALVVIGDRLGLYRAMADGTPVSAEELAERTGTDPRYVREWLSNQAAGGYVSYDPAGEAFFLTPEQSLALAQEGSPAFVPGAFQVATALTKDEEKIADAFVGRHGVGWHEHHHDLFAGTERFFRPGYAANLVSAWIPALDGRRGETPIRGARRRRRLRPRRVDDPDGAGVPAVAFRRVRLPRGLDRSGHGRPRVTRGCKTGCGSRSPRPSSTPATGTTWWRCSTACTTWATRSAPPPTCSRRSPRTAPG